MNWNTIISGNRTGGTTISSEIRTDYQRDFDRLVFSSAFRRLQNKTQVFPLPGATFVHNRLTHSLEVASVGRSLGKIVGKQLVDKGYIDAHYQEFYQYELQNVIASACLAHDIGNPSFGHSGEKAISAYFESNAHVGIEPGKALQDYFKPEEWLDLISFEGNANSFRTLTHQFKGKSAGGYQLTYSTLASILKYPCESTAIKTENINTKKFSFFQSEKALAVDILNALTISKQSDDPLVYSRHPFVTLTEAADDICYRIVDFEDAQRMHILPHKQVAELFSSLIENIGRKTDDMDAIRATYNRISDKNEQIAYLRAKCINTLTRESADLYIHNADRIINGSYNNGLLDVLTDQNALLSEIKKISIDNIYNHDSVLELEIAGFKIMSDLLSLFVPAMLKQNPDHRDQKILRLIPEQFHSGDDTVYKKVLSVLDYLSGMTDPYAIELYRKLFGIEIPKY
ncbi:MAG: dNTP triphosphohydrolase [candidate division KSB1 bacterium]|nr:dNTP triphosphohydrolase [candidate division KSB1 bacterium]